ncbi:uncharacterized protein LOC110721454 isoform X2 [Chenopodium quinoa]|uniref:uncharacterized protein LOC110721454 isoform X2 n=1 Tax=Chenopodium quinoa TaxID=63459 RepID=UPI000B786EE2|nr:uncharacterized protein LOC110721454 isoform X2 [Chenopodium quinoa]
MRKNPRKPKTQKVVEEKETSDSETSENSNSDDPKIPENKATEYEKQRELRIAQNKARIEDLGLRNIANSLMNLSQKGGKRKSNLNSKRVPKNGKDDDEYQPIDEDPKDDSSDSSLDSSSEEFEEQEKRKKKKQKKKVELDSRVVIPDSSLQFMGHCGEKICLTFPEGPEEEVKELMDCFPKGFNGADCWKLRRSYVIYPEFCEEVMEGLPFPEGFNGFNLEESKEICGVIVALINAQSRLKKLFQSYVQGSKSFPCPQYQPYTQVFRPQHQAFTQVTCHQHQASTQVPCPQHQAATPVTDPVQFNALMYPDHGQFFPYWCPPMTPFGMAPTAWNPYNANYAPPYMGNSSGMP